MKLKFIKFIFLTMLILVIYYILEIETEKYASKTIVTVKDLSQKQSVTSISSMILGQGDINVKQNLELISVYIKSLDMYKKLDKDFNLTRYYTSQKLDFLHRLYKDSNIPYFQESEENLLKRYNNDLEIYYDDLSSSLEISFNHISPKISKAIVEHIIKYSEVFLNSLDKENAKELLNFLQKQEKEYRLKYVTTIKKIISFQNKVGLIDPDINIQAKSELLANLESELIRKEIEYQAKLIKFTPNAQEVKIVKKEINNLKNEIKKIKSLLTGNKTKQKIKLNQDKFTFELLKNELLLNQELYKQSLLKLEDAKISSSQNSKNLITVVKPNLPQQYNRPNKLKDIFTAVIIFIFLYGTLKITLIILYEHKD